jgi:hypothetical protein
LNGEPLRNIAERSGTSTTALHRHKKEHIAPALASTKRATEEVNAETLFERLRAINRETAAILAEARASNSPGVALLAIARAEKQLELEARLVGQLNDSVKVALGINVKGTPELTEDEKYVAQILTHEELEILRERLQDVNGTRRITLT